MHNREIIDSAFRQAGVTPRVIVETNTISVLYARVRSGEMYSVMPISALPDYFLDGAITLHKLEPAHGALVAMLRLRQGVMPPLIEEAWRTTAEQDLQAALDDVLDEEIHAVHRSS